MQNEPATRLDGASDLNGKRQHLARNLVIGIAGGNAQSFEKIGRRNVVSALIDDEAHGPFRRMGTHIDDRTLESPICHRRHCDEELPFELYIRPTCLARLSACFHMLETSSIERRREDAQECNKDASITPSF